MVRVRLSHSGGECNPDVVAINQGGSVSVVINTNYAATVASNNLAASGQLLQRSLNRLSSGSKIVNPADDAGGLAVSMKLSAAARRQGAVNGNIGNAVSLLQTQDGALRVTGAIFNRISELKVLNSDITKSASDRANYQSEFAALQAEITAIGSEKFNGVSLFGSAALTIQTTENGVGSVTAQGVNMVGAITGAPAFATISDNFTTLGQWTNSGTDPATVAGHELYLPGLSTTLRTNQSLSGPFTVDFDLRAEFANFGDFNVRLGSTFLFTSPLATDTSSHHLQITNDGAGHVAWSLDGASTGNTTIAANASGKLEFSQFGSGNGSYLSAFSAVSNPASAPTNVASMASASSLGTLSLSTITGAIQDVATYRAQNGATQSRLDFASELVSVNKANLEAATSRIIDVDVAVESTQLARYNILLQAGTAMLSQANQYAQTALKLLG